MDHRVVHAKSGTVANGDETRNKAPPVFKLENTDARLGHVMLLLLILHMTG